jgi:hypothetical protein
MFVIILSSFNISKDKEESNESTLECSATIKLVNVCSLRKEIYSYLKKNPNCGFPLITNYVSKEEYKTNKNVIQTMYYKFEKLEKDYSTDNLGSVSLYNVSKDINIVLNKKITVDEDSSIDQTSIRMYMNDLVIRISNILLENLSIPSKESFKKIRLADKYINNFITRRSDCYFIYRLYQEDEKRSPALSNEDLNNLLVSVKN